jgi:hypothetical protein
MFRVVFYLAIVFAFYASEICGLACILSAIAWFRHIGYAQLTNTSVLALVGDPDARAY